MRRQALAITAVCAAAIGSARAQAPSAAHPPSFGYERTVIVDSVGWNRLALDAAILAGGTPFRVSGSTVAGGTPLAVGGLSDLRLYDEAGREVPYLLVRADAARTRGLPHTRSRSRPMRRIPSAASRSISAPPVA